MGNLFWEGKIKRVENLKNIINQKVKPFQVIESINSPILANLKEEIKIDHFLTVKSASSSKLNDAWENLLIWGDNTSVMLNLLKNQAGKINLIYIDPPFATGGDFNYKIQIGESETSKRSKEWVRKLAYSDAWKEGIDSYLNFLYERLLLMKELLADNGSIYVHLDWHVGHYVKVMMDEIFGVENFRNEIIWAYPAASAQTRRFFIRSYDTILFYSKSDKYTFNDDPEIYMEYSDRVKKALKMDENGLFYFRGGTHDGKKLSRKVYVKNQGIFPRDVWNDIPYIRANTLEYQGFSTQKPEHLLKRIILASTKKNDIIADFFCGSGTTLAVAEKLGRRWIGCDIEKHAIHMTKKRLLSIYNGNDLFNWKKKYEKKVLPFKIISLKGKEKEPFIPHEFLSESIQEKADLNILERPTFIVNIQIKDCSVIFELKDYEIPFLDLVTDKIKGNVHNWADWIDFWAIDFNYKDVPFNNMWISYRTPKNRKLNLTSSPHEYNDPGKRVVKIKLIDIFGIESFQKHEIIIKK